MKINAALTFAFCLLLTSCMGEVPESFVEDSSEEPIGEAEQGLCTSHCNCQPGYKCSNGVCTWPLDFGPPFEEPCYADCHCSADKFCFPSGQGGYCIKPEIQFTSGNWNDCGSNAGVAHPSPDALVRMTIVGKPGATVKKYNRHYSCGGAAQWWLDTSLNGVTIPANGLLSIDYPTNAPFACNDKTLGGWQNYVEVAGRTSYVTSFTFYNSPCGGSLSTCDLASSYCPPSGPCNGVGCP
jgi:hypothetical protein